MTIKGGGNVGIGVTNPSEKLVVDGKVIINNTTAPNNLAQLNIGSTGGGETRAIDIDGNWQNSESKSITFTHGSASTEMVGQINCVYNSPSSSIRWGKLYHGGDSSTYTMELESTSLTTANLTVAGSIQMADDTATASAAKVGTMRYRTATNEPVAVTGIDFITNGDFATDTDWTKSSNVSISGGQATFTANSAAQYIIQGSLWPANSLSGQKVQLTYTVISNSLNAGNFRIGGYTGASAFTLTGLPTTVGTHSVTLDVRTSVGDDNAIDLYVTNAATSGVFVIDNVALIEVTEEDASYADMCMQTGASTYEWVNIVRNTY